MYILILPHDSNNVNTLVLQIDKAEFKTLTLYNKNNSNISKIRLNITGS